MKLLCVGDIHLGRQPARLPAGLLDEIKASELGPAAAWRLAVDFALADEVDAVLLAGDVVEQEDDFYEAYGDLRRGVDRLAAAGVPVLAVSGNHDVQVLPRLADAVPGFQLLGRGGRWEVLEVTSRNGRRRVQVLGWSFPERRVSTSPLEAHEFPALDRGSGPVVGLLHCDRDAAGSPYAPVRSTELAQAPVDAWLLGHIHQPDRLAPPRPIGYLGSLTGLDPGEPGPRGPWRLECAGPEFALEHLPLGPLRWEEIEVALDGLESAEEVHTLTVSALDALHERLCAERFRPRATGCRLRFTGRTAHPNEVRRSLAASDPLRILHPRDDVVYFVHDWRFEASPALDLDELARGADPPALLARKILLLRRPAEDPERQALLADARRRLESQGARRPFNGFNPPAEEEAAELLERAALGALAELLNQREGPA